MSVKLSRVILFGPLAWLLALGALGAVAWIVDDDDPTADFSRIQPAINVAVNMDVVQVRCGLYPENIVMKNGVSVIGQGAGCTILDGGRAGTVVTFVGIRRRPALGIPPTEFSGFTVRNGRSSQGGGMFISDSDPIITHSVIIGNEALRTPSGYYGVGGGIALTDSAPIVSNNLIVGNSAERTGGGVDMYFSYPMLSNNTIIGNRAVQPGSGYGYGGGAYALFSDPMLQSNVIVDNSAEGGGGGIDLINSSATRIEYTDTFGNVPLNISGAFVAGPGNISQDPLFVDAGSLDVCPRSHSPAIDTGLPTGSQFLTDLFSRPRHVDGDFDGPLGNGARIDMGACEGGDITRLMVDAGGTVSWDPSVGRGAVFNLYRGVLSALRSSCATACVYTQDPAAVPGASRQCGLASPGFTDLDVPPLGGAYYYLATGERALEGVLGFRADGSVMTNDNPCP
ncbi:MAG: hypothetical protein HY613_02795 [Candidatus Rokubacteria bacterium]|nr:hypothetical protein [Candidatus Rokubacteria bacterium]